MKIFTSAYSEELTAVYSQEAIDKAPTIEAEPVKHGEWIHSYVPIFGNPYGSYQCSLCDAKIEYKTDYCPNCGAKMNGK